jgi:PAS domain S-box-containing protein
MAVIARNRGFLRSRSAQGLAVFLGFSVLVAGSVGYGFYAASVAWFMEHKSQEKVTALRLVDAFVQNYSDIRAKVGPSAPVPATFRAHSIELFDKSMKDRDDFILRWVGREGRVIATPPSDAAMARTIESFAHETDPKPRSELVTVNGTHVFRTVYPSFAQQQSCVDCHNALEPEQHWKLGELMGAFSIDVPVGPFLRSSLIEAGGLGAALLVVLACAGLTVAMLHYRQICAREAVQVSLEDSEARFRDFAATASDWFWEQDEALRFVYTSSGSPGQSVLGRTRRGLIESGENLGVDEAQLRAHEQDLEARRPFQNLRFQRLLPSGELRHISVSGLPVFDADGRFRGYRGTGRDVTVEVAAEIELGHRVEERTAELRKAQGELVRKEKLSTLGQLTATVAHELRNPLSAIRNTIFAVKENLQGKGIDLDRPLSRVERNIQRCDRIITDLLDFTRMRELNRAEVDADAWLDEVLNEQRLPDGVAVVRDFGAPGCHVDFDPERMRRVVINLIENAAQAMSEDTGSARAVTVRTRAADGGFALEVEDSGSGISRDILAKVFEPLFSTKSFGTGLGLPTVKQIVEQHGGTVAIWSEPGKGTRVVVRLPLKEAEELAA